MTVEASEPPPADPRSRARRELAATVVLCAAGALLELFAVGRPWAKVIGTTTRTYSGSSLTSVVRPLSLVALAGAAALLATKRWGRQVVGLLIVAAGVGTAIAAIVVGDPAAVSAVHHLPAWRVVTVVAAVPVVLSGLAAAARGNRWTVMSARYDAPGTGRPRAQDPDVALWDALDRGDDPTGEPAG